MASLFEHYLRFLTGRKTSWISLGIALVIAGGLFALLPGQPSGGYPVSGLPDSAQSQQVDQMLRQFPSADTTVGIVVYTADGTTLEEADHQAIASSAQRLAAASNAPQAVQPQFSSDGTAAIVAVPLAAGEVAQDVGDAAKELRDTANDQLPAGLHAYLTGPVGFQADVAGSFAGADTRLLLVTVAVVALLLIVTYRSPVLWLVPLAVVATGDGLARQLATSIGAAVGVQIDASISGIMSVLVFGAGTNYALLMVARYREELRKQQDHHLAMQQALRSTYPAVIASGSTVTLALLTLTLATLGSNRTLGWACAVGVVTAMAAALVILPPALVVCGRRLFWPLVPRFVPDAVPHLGPWGRLGRWVEGRPYRVIAGAVVGLAVLALGMVGMRVGLPQTQQFVGTPESVQGQQIVDETFGPGATSRTIILVPDAGAAQAVTIAQSTDGVATATAGEQANGWTEVDVTLSAEPATPAAFTSIESLRSALADAPGPVSRALVGGQDATALDELNTAQADQRLIMPVILVLVLVILMILLRAVVAPVLLIATVLATFAAAMGAGVFLFRHVFGFQALDTSVQLFSFLFLVALGVDYNIFLTTRAREERSQYGTREGMVRALAATGGVITSAGVLLAAVFAVLGVLPVVALMQIGVIVCVGVLLDTLVVRTLVVPALAFVTGDKFWWPARVARAGGSQPAAAVGELHPVSPRGR